MSPDNQGNVYIVDGDNRIRKIDANGIMSTFAGNGTGNYAGDGGPAPMAEIQNPSDVLADSKGNVFIADTGNVRVREVNAQGIISTFAGSGVDQPGSIYPSALPRQSGGPAVAYSLSYPLSLAINSSDDLYIADAELSKVFKVDGNGVISDFAGNGNFWLRVCRRTGNLDWILSEFYLVRFERQSRDRGLSERGHLRNISVWCCVTT